MAASYLTPADFRGTGLPLDNSEKFPDPMIADAVAEFEEIAEEYRGVAFTPREAEWTDPDRCHWYGPRRVLLPHSKIITVTTTLDDDDYTDPLILDSEAGILTLPLYGAWVVTYTHGYSTPPRLILAACRDYVTLCCLRSLSGTSREAIATSADGVTYRYSTPDPAAGRPTGYMDVDRRLNMVADHRVPGIA